MLKGTDNIHFIPVSAIPQGRKVTYLKIVAADKPHKANKRCVHFTVGGDRVDYKGDVSTKTADLTTAKCLFNSVISTSGAKFMTADIKDFYLNTPMNRYEYMCIPEKDIPATIMTQYNLAPLLHNGAVYIKIRKGMYGLPQAGRIANDQLLVFLAQDGYHQAPNTPGLFTHTTRPITFSLIVDNFGVKYVSLTTLQKFYTITTDWTGSEYCGLSLLWDYEARIIDLSMPGYIQKALSRFQHTLPTRAQHSPYKWTKPNYGVPTQLTPEPDDSALLDKAAITHLQEVIGTLLFYARAIDSTMLIALGTLPSAQSQGTKATAKACTHLLNYCATHPNAVIRYTASGMILHLHSDASYLSEAKAWSRAGGNIRP
jgi:hypothetical protein